MNEPSKPTTQEVSLEDSRLTADEIADIRWLEKEYEVVWDSHAVEFVRYDWRHNELEMCTIVSGRGHDMEEIKYRSRDRLGDFENDNLIDWSINGEFPVLPVSHHRRESEHPPDTLTDEEFAVIYEVRDGYNRGLDWS